MVIRSLLDGLKTVFLLAAVMAVVMTAVFLAYGRVRRYLLERRLRGPVSDLLDHLIAKLRARPSYAAVVLADSEDSDGGSSVRTLIIEPDDELCYHFSVDLKTGRIWVAVPDRRVVFPIGFWIDSPWLASRFSEINRQLNRLPR